MTLKENIVMRLIGLFIFVAPGHGVKFMATIYIDLRERMKAGA